MVKANGRRDCVTHTVPNMAAADQSPPSIDCPEHSTTIFFFLFFFLSCLEGGHT